jgi:uncharacterized protein (TIGR02996 family)
MADDRPFIEAIRASPDEDDLRLIYADWLEEHDECYRAEFIRLQCQLEPIRRQYEDDEATSLRVREADLLLKHREGWLAELLALMGRWSGFDPSNVTFRRGFVDAIALPVQWYLQHGAAIHHLFPLLRRVRLFRLAGWGRRLAQFPVPAELEMLEVTCWIWGEDAEAIATSPHLRNLARLRLWLGNREDPDADAEVCRALAPCSSWPRLSELRLTAVCEDPEELRPAFRALAQVLARPLAKFVNPWSRPYVFSPQRFRNNFPGRLPSGEQVFGKWVGGRGTWPPDPRVRLVLLRFDPKGNQLGELEVVFPEHCLQATSTTPEAEQDFIRRRAEYLRETLGHQPALVRVKSMRYAGHSLVSDYPTWEVDSMGAPDDPEYGPEQDELHGVEGMGGSLDGWIERDGFVFTGNGGNTEVDESGGGG